MPWERRGNYEHSQITVSYQQLLVDIKDDHRQTACHRRRKYEAGVRGLETRGGAGVRGLEPGGRGEGTGTRGAGVRGLEPGVSGTNTTIYF